MAKLDVTIINAQDGQSWPAEVVTDKPVGWWIEQILEALNLPREEDGQRVTYHFILERTGQAVSEKETLQSAGIQAGDRLLLERLPLPEQPEELPAAERRHPPPSRSITTPVRKPGILRFWKAGIIIAVGLACIAVGLACVSLPLYLHSRVVNTFANPELDIWETGNVTFSPDGSILAVWSQSKINLWDVQSGEQIQGMSDTEHIIQGISFSPDGSQVLVSRSEIELESLDFGGMAGEITLGWEIDGSGRIGSLSVEDEHNGLTALVFSPDAETYAAGYFSGDVVVVNLKTGDQYTLHPSASLNLVDARYSLVHSMAFSPDGKSLAVQLWLGELIVYDVETGQTLLTPNPEVYIVEAGFQDFASRDRADSPWFQSILFSPDGHYLISRDTYSASMFLWDAHTGDLRYFLRHGSSESYPTVISPDGRMMATSCCREAFLVDLSVFDATSCSDSRRLDMCPDSTAGIRELDTPDGVISMAFSPDGSLLAVGSGGNVRLFDGQTGKKNRTLTNFLVRHEPYGTALAFSPDGAMLASVDRSGKVILWDVSR